MRHARKRSRQPLCVGFAVAAVLIPFSGLFAQEPPKPPAPRPAPPPVAAPAAPAPIQMRLPQVVGRGGEEAMTNAAFVQPPRERLRLLSRAKQLLGREALLRGRQGTGRDPAIGRRRRAPHAAGRIDPLPQGRGGALIAAMPAEGRAAYQREYAAQAGRLFEEAVKSGDVGGIERVAGQFFHTPAGYEATQLLAHVHLDHDRALAAALCFERLARSAGSRQVSGAAAVLQDGRRLALGRQSGARPADAAGVEATRAQEPG